MLEKFNTIVRVSTAIAKIEFKLKNEGSYLGILWYLLNPLFMFLLLMGIFSSSLGQKIILYQPYLMFGIIMFNFFHQATLESIRTIYNNRLIIKSINFPIVTLVYAVILKTLISHMIELLLFIGLLIFLKVSLVGIIFYPFIIVFFCMFTAGCCFLLSSLAVFLVDLENIWLFASRLLWFATPIFYAIESESKMITINFFNPIYYFITISRDVIIYSKMPSLWMILGAMGYALITLSIGLFVFNKLNRKFAELI